MKNNRLNRIARDIELYGEMWIDTKIAHELEDRGVVYCTDLRGNGQIFCTFLKREAA
jgi:hypothetical protein